MSKIVALKAGRRRVRMYLCVSLVLVASLVAAGVALAATYSCGACNGVNGPNQSMRWMEGINYNANEIIDTIWKYNGGSNYNVDQQGFTTSSYKLTLGDLCVCDETAHGNVSIFTESSHLAGRDEP